jgi:hypothetical protein
MCIYKGGNYPLGFSGLGSDAYQGGLCILLAGALPCSRPLCF